MYIRTLDTDIVVKYQQLLLLPLTPLKPPRYQMCVHSILTIVRCTIIIHIV